MLKTCAKCQIEKPIGEFHKNRATSDGLQKYCKPCRAEYAQTPQWEAARKRYQNSAKGKKAHKRYQQSEKGVRAHRRAVRKYNRKVRAEPLASGKAHDAVRRAIKSGKLPHISMCSCSQCSKQAKQYHHTNGYDEANWLNVIPVCIQCHQSLH